LGKREEAYKAYQKAIRQNPPYELEFNARIAQTEVMAKGNYKKMIARLNRMAHSDNNKDYLDQVYYAIGNIHMMQRDTIKAIAAYEKVSCDYNGDDLTIGFKSTFLSEILSNMGCDTVVMKFADARRAALIVPSEEDEESGKLCGILMPIMVQ
jgi:tetratricopeptide (TPR) repeat protein